MSGHLRTLRLTPNEVSSGPGGVMWRKNGQKRWKNGQNGQNEQISSKKKSGKKDIFEEKNFIIQSGMKKRPMQAFTALCRTKIVAATPVQRGGRF